MVTPTELPSALPNHRIPGTHFDALCAGLGDRDVIRELWRTQRSRRLLLINAVVGAAVAEPALLGPLPPASAAWDALVAAEASAPAEFATVLLHPLVGSWAAYALRRHRGRADSDTPLWIDFGVLHAVALVAAARAGLGWQTLVPARTGHVMLPGLGLATFEDLPSSASFVQAKTEDGEIRLCHGGREVTVSAHTLGDHPGWWSLRRLTAGTGPTLSVLLDDLDPFRDLADPVEPDRLDDTTVARWAGLLEGAWALLCRYHRATAEAMADGVVSLVPLPVGDGWETRSASTGEAFGSVMVSPPSDAQTLAVSLVHEFQHIKLGGLMHLGPLSDDGDGEVYYAPWRDDPRPLGGLIQGLYAFVGIAAFWRDHRQTVETGDRRAADFEYAYARTQVAEALRIVSRSGGLTAWGDRLVQGLTDRVRPWLAERLPADAVRAAAVVADHHRAGWRIRHIRPPPADVEALVRAWSGSRAAPELVAGGEVVPDRERRWSRGMLAWVRRRISMPEAPLTDRLRALGLTEAEVALVDGEAAVAAAAFRARIAANVEDVDAWVGLGLAAGSRSALDHRPELVRAVYRRLAVDGGRLPDPVLLAEWVDGGGSGTNRLSSCSG